MDGLSAYGRGWREPYFTVNAEGGTARIRVDDKKNPEAWLTICLSESALLELLHLVQPPELPEPPVPVPPPSPYPEIPDLPPQGGI